MLLSIIIFFIVYLFIITEKIDKTVVAILGAFVMMVTGILPYDTAINAIDFNVIFLLIGMMTCVFILSTTGFFEWLSVSIAQKTNGRPLLILIFFLFLTAVLSAFLDNVTTIILLAPVTILITQLLEISATPFLILEAIASNIGGTATLIGDPPNIVIGSQAGLSFNDFLFNLGPVILIVLLFFIGTVYLIFRRHWKIPDSTRQRVIDAVPRLAIIDKPNMIRALIILGCIFIAFFIHDLIHLKPGIIAITGAMLMIIFCRTTVDKTFYKVEWSVIFFFIGLFMLIAGLEYNGVLEFLAESVITIFGKNLFVMCVVILCFSAVVSSFLDNIPFVITMVPMVEQIIVQFSSLAEINDPALIQAQIAEPLWWSLALGSCLGGNGSLIGASANIIVSKIGEKNNSPISFIRFFKYGFPFMLQSLIICIIYIYLRYF